MTDHWIERLLEEERQLSDRCVKLRDALGTVTFSEEDHDDLVEQYQYMVQYLTVLHRRMIRQT